jgi:preprotein translocase subunit SecG
MPDPLVKAHDVSRTALWWGLLGSGIAWLLHLLLAYAIAEFGCVLYVERYSFLGITLVAWLLIAVTVLTAAAAGVAALVAVRASRKITGDDIYATRGTAEYMARVGVLASVLFIFVILVQSVPIFFYLRHC